MKKQKMNVLFKIAFILLIICVLLILASIIIAYAFDSEKWSAITSASGVLLATVGIILGMLSKPKKVKLKDENKENNNINTATQLLIYMIYLFILAIVSYLCVYKYDLAYTQQ